MQFKCIRCGRSEHEDDSNFCGTCGLEINGNYCTNDYCDVRNNGQHIPCYPTDCYCNDCGAETVFFRMGLLSLPSSEQLHESVAPWFAFRNFRSNLHTLRALCVCIWDNRVCKSYQVPFVVRVIGTLCPGAETGHSDECSVRCSWSSCRISLNSLCAVADAVRSIPTIIPARQHNIMSCLVLMIGFSLLW